jgi:hypothetical protein
MPNLTIDELRVASPCDVPWSSMAGTHTVRACNDCKKKVYNLSVLTREEANATILATEGNLCVQLYRRFDGTVLTADCPIGLRKLRRGYLMTRARIAGAAVALLAFIGLSASSCRDAVIGNGHPCRGYFVDPSRFDQVVAVETKNILVRRVIMHLRSRILFFVVFIGLTLPGSAARAQWSVIAGYHGLEYQYAEIGIARHSLENYVGGPCGIYACSCFGVTSSMLVGPARLYTIGSVGWVGLLGLTLGGTVQYATDLSHSTVNVIPEIGFGDFKIAEIGRGDVNVRATYSYTLGNLLPRNESG